MTLDDAFADEQPEAVSASRLGCLGVSRDEGFEDPIAYGLGYPAALVGNRHDGVIVFSEYANGDRALSRMTKRWV